MKRILLISFLTSFGLSLLQAQTEAKNQIKQQFEDKLNEADVHNGFLQIKSGNNSINWKFVGGAFQDGTMVREVHPFHSASVGKMFTAAIIMKLAEAGKLQTSDPIYEHLAIETMDRLHVFNGKDYSKEITIAQLLQHTSGLADYIMDEPKDGSPNLITQMFIEPNKLWKVEEFITITKEKLSPHFAPGKGYNYTDTEYILLGLIIEKKYHKDLHQVFLEELFLPLQMNHTALFMRSQPIEKNEKMTEFYVDKMDISTFNSLTIDWAGGGLVSTTEDLLRFHQALFSKKIVSEYSLSEMQDWHPESIGSYYGFGLRKYVINEISKDLPNLTVIGHSGISGSFSFYCPELDVFVAGTFNQSNQIEKAIEFLMQTLVILKYSY